jgi:release factor glutamine methyltransferase
VARANLAGSGSAVGTRVRLLEGDWWGALPDELRGQVDVVVSNPPYVAGGEDLPPEVEDWEPQGALRAGHTGREALEVVVGGAPDWLGDSGVLVVELAPHQAEPMADFARRAGFAAVQVVDDLAGRRRVLVARTS